MYQVSRRCIAKASAQAALQKVEKYSGKTNTKSAFYLEIKLLRAISVKMSKNDLFYFILPIYSI